MLIIFFAGIDPLRELYPPMKTLLLGLILLIASPVILSSTPLQRLSQ